MKQLHPVKDKRESNRTVRKRMNKRFASRGQKMIKVQYDTDLPESTAREQGKFESAALMGKRQFQRQEKPMAWEVSEDVSELDPYRGTDKSLYQRDVERLQKQMRTVRKHYKDEYNAAIAKRKKQLAQELAVTTELKTERLVQKRIKAHYNKLAHEKRHEIQRQLTAARKVGLTKRRIAFEEFQEKQR